MNAHLKVLLTMLGIAGYFTLGFTFPLVFLATFALIAFGIIYAVFYDCFTNTDPF